MNAVKYKLVAFALLGMIVLAPRIAVPQTVDLTGNSKGLILDAFRYFTYSDPDPSYAINQDLSKLCSGQPDMPNNADITAFKAMGNGYGAVVIESHGVPDKNGQVAILAEDPVTPQTKQAYLPDVVAGRIEPIAWTTDGKVTFEVWAITPAFVEYYAGALPQSLVLDSACSSYLDAQFSSAFLSSGAKAYFGYDNTVYSDDASRVEKALFGVLTDLTLSPDQRTTQAAYNSVGSAAGLELAAGSDPNLALQGGVINGGFETGDLTGWSRDFLYGAYPYCYEYTDLFSPTPFTGEACVGPNGPFATATTDQHADGQWSGRIGRWDTPYAPPHDPNNCDTSGFCGELGAPYPMTGWPMSGAEPSGFDQMYQDVQVGSPQNSGSITLTFSYNILTYAEYLDSFYVQVRDPTISPPDPTDGTEYADVPVVANSSEVVPYDWSDIEGPLFEFYGFYSTTGWMTQSFDLTPWAGKTVRLLFGVTQGGWGAQTAVYLDQIAINCR